MQLKQFFQFVTVGAISLFLAACETAEVVYTKLPERDVNEMIAVLSTAGINADRVNKTEEKEGITYDLQISDKTHFADAVKTLSSQGYPRKTFKTFGDVFKGDGMVSTPLEQKARYLYALSEGISQTLNDIDGVNNARVHIVLSEVDPISRQRMPASASVMIQHEARMDTTTLIPKVKKLLSTAIDGLSYENVNVILFQEGAGGHKEEPALSVAIPTEAKIPAVLSPASFSEHQSLNANNPSQKTSDMRSFEETPQQNQYLSSENSEEAGYKEYYQKYAEQFMGNTGSTIFILMGLLLVIFILIFVVLFLKRGDNKATGQDLVYYE
jgi:type III secretion protein J